MFVKYAMHRSWHGLCIGTGREFTGGGCRMTNQERLDLAERVQKNIQKKSADFRIIRRKEQIEKEFESAPEGRQN